MIWFHVILIINILVQVKSVFISSYISNQCSSVNLCFHLWFAGKYSEIEYYPKLFSNWHLNCSRHSDIFPIDKSSLNHPRQVNGYIFSESQPKPFANPTLAVISNNAVEDILDLNFTNCVSLNGFLNFVSGRILNNDCQPLAHRYGGHQFGDWAGQLGDGRAHLLGEYRNHMGAISELQLKGSGITPYSRRGDGRAVIRSSIREFLCSEAMYSLGVSTSRAISLVVSDEDVIRDQFYNGNIKAEKGAVVLRSSPTWFRIGSLEILSSEQEFENLELLIDHFIDTFLSDDKNSMQGIQYLYNVHYDVIDIKHHKNKRISYVKFFEIVQNLTIATVVDWMSYGFAHGVCNTDNYSLLGVTIDYGPFGFVEAYDPNYVPNTSDDTGRYSLIGQASIAMENMNRLLNAISPLLSKTQRKECNKILNNFNKIYQSSLIKRFRKKLGLLTDVEDDGNLVAALLYIMEKTKADFTMTFYELSQLSNDQLQNPSTIPDAMWSLKLMQNNEYFGEWMDMYYQRLQLNPKSFNHKWNMKRFNPRYVLRNWMAERAIKSGEGGNFAELKLLHEVLQNPYQINTQAEKLGFAGKPPKWAKNIKVSCSS